MTHSDSWQCCAPTASRWRSASDRSVFQDTTQDRRRHTLDMTGQRGVLRSCASPPISHGKLNADTLHVSAGSAPAGVRTYFRLARSADPCRVALASQNDPQISGVNRCRPRGSPQASRSAWISPQSVRHSVQIAASPANFPHGLSTVDARPETWWRCLPQKLHRQRVASSETAWTGPNVVSAVLPEAMTASASSTHAWQM